MNMIPLPLIAKAALLSCSIALATGCSEENKSMDPISRAAQSIANDIPEMDRLVLAATPPNIRNVAYSRTLGIGIRNEHGLWVPDSFPSELSQECERVLGTLEEEEFAGSCSSLVIQRLWLIIENELPSVSRKFISLQNSVFSMLDMGEFSQALFQEELEAVEAIKAVNEVIRKAGLSLEITFGSDVSIADGRFTDETRNFLLRYRHDRGSISAMDVIYSVALHSALCVQHKPGEILLAIDCRLEGNHWDWTK